MGFLHRRVPLTISYPLYRAGAGLEYSPDIDRKRRSGCPKRDLGGSTSRRDRGAQAELFRLWAAVLAFAALVGVEAGGAELEGALQYPPPSVGQDAHPPPPAKPVPQLVSPWRIELGISGSSAPPDTQLFPEAPADLGTWSTAVDPKRKLVASRPRSRRDGCSIRRRNARARLARSAGLFPMRQPAHRNACDRNEAAPRVGEPSDAAPRQPLG
jgi:hypothetical protein